MQDLLEQLELEAIRTKSGDGKYYRLRSTHLYRVLNYCESMPELRVIMDEKFYGHYIRRVARVLGREIRLVTKLTNTNMACALDLNNLKRISGLLDEEVAPMAHSAISVKIPHRGGFRVYPQGWINNHAVLFFTALTE